MASTAWVALLTLTCAIVLGDQAEVRLTEEPAVAKAMTDLGEEKFMAIPGVPGGAEIYKELSVKSMVECSGLCGGDEDCTSYEYDINFGKCKLMKVNVKKLEAQTEKVAGQEVAGEAKAAAKEAAVMVKAEEAEKKKEEQDVEKVEETPVEQLVKGPTPRDIYRTAIKKEKESKVLVRDRQAASKEAAMKLKGSQTVERIVKRHEQELMVDFNKEHKSYSAAMLNMEEQVMIRDDRNSKEVILAKGAKEEAEIKFDKIHTRLLNTQRLLKKAEDMGALQQAANVAASQAFVQSKMDSKGALEKLNEARVAYKSAELQGKNAADLKKRQAAELAQTYIKLRGQKQERDARAAQGSVVDFKKADAAAKTNCQEEQRKMKEAEFKIKQELSEEIGAKERAIAEKDIARMKAESTRNVNKANAAKTQELVAAAKAKADGNVADMMSVMSEDHMLGESKATAGDAAKAVAEAALDKAKANVATANAALDAARKESKDADDVADSAQKALAGEKDDDKKEPLKEALKAAKANAKEAADKAAKLTRARTRAELEETRAKSSFANADADAEKSKVALKLQKGMEKKAILEAEEKATMEASKAKMAAMSSLERNAHEIRQSTAKKIAGLVEAAWQKKKAELGFKVINCDSPHETTEDQLRGRIKELELEKLRATPTAPAGDTLPAAAVKEIEARVQETAKAEFQTELAQEKKENKEKMAAQLKNERAIIDRDAKESHKEVEAAKQAEAKAKAAAAASAEAAARAEKDAKPVAKQQTWGIMNKIRSMF